MADFEKGRQVMLMMIVYLLGLLCGILLAQII